MSRDLIRHATAAGWRVSRTSGGHLRLEHRDATMPVFTASTPSDHRAMRNALATMRRALPPEEKPEPKVSRPKRKGQPKPRDVSAAIELYRPAREIEPMHGGSAPRRPSRPLPGGPSGYVMTRWLA
jgi:hypothetical protein